MVQTQTVPSQSLAAAAQAGRSLQGLAHQRIQAMPPGLNSARHSTTGTAAASVAQATVTRSQPT